MSQLNTTARGPGRPPDRALHHRRCGQILRQAEDFFARGGYADTDLQRVADALGLAKGTVYRYFPSKQALFLATVRQGVMRLQRHIDQVSSAVDDPIERLAAGVRAYLQFFKENPQLVELFIQERAVFGKRRTPIYFKLREAARQPWSRLLSREISRGRIRKMPVQRILKVIGDLVYGTMFTAHFAGRSESSAAQAADILDVVFNGILSASEPSSRRKKAIG